MNLSRCVTPLAIAAFAVLTPAASAAVTPSRTATDLSAALTDGGSGVSVAGASFAALPPTGNPAAVLDSPVAGFPTAGTKAVVLSTGDSSLLASPNATGTTSSDNGGPPRGASDRDAVVLKVDVNVPSNANCLTFDFRFFSEEYPEYVGASYNDAFIAEMDKTTWTTSASQITAPDNFAFDPSGAVVSINSTGATSVSAENAAGTTYDAGTALLHASKEVTPGQHSIYFSIFDQGDAKLDSTVLIDNLVARSAAAGACTSGATTAPPASAPATPTKIFGPGGVVSAPSNKKCISRRSFRIRVRKRKGIKYEVVVVFVNKKRVTTRRGKRITAPIDLRGLPKGRYTVKISVLTSTGQFIIGTRKYRTCTKKSKGGGGPL